MRIQNVELDLQRVEAVTKSYDHLGRVVREQWEYYFPKEFQPQIGFQALNKKISMRRKI